ncbi:hypothetical protein SBA6_700008 [Candidatus Sulfopaludibacter sp. SbA6]|nr:hypothetical protein SBA6_700008 [Candidatus Sulfopaludibacter sp. SbA6]
MQHPNAEGIWYVPCLDQSIASEMFSLFA